MGPIEKDVFGYLQEPKTIEQVCREASMPLKQVRPAIQRLVNNGYLEKVPTPGMGNHEMRYKIRTDWTEKKLKPEPRGPQVKPRPRKPRKPKKQRFNVLGVWI